MVVFRSYVKHISSGRIRLYTVIFAWGILSAGFLLNAFFGNIHLVHAAAKTWDGGGADGTCGGQAGDGNKWSCALNWSGDTVPVAGDTLTFNGTSTKDATVDAGFTASVTSLTISSGYTGTITLANGLTITNSYSQADGVLNATSQSLSIGSSFTLSAGVFTASSGTTSIGGGMTISGSSTFNANGGTLNINNNNGTLACNNVTFNLVTFNNTGTKTVNSDCSMPLGNNPSIAHSVTLSGTLSGTGTLTTAQAFTLNSGAVLSGFGAYSGVGFTNAGATADFSSYSTFSTSGIFTLSSGTITLPNGADLNASFIISGGTFNAPSGTMTAATTITISGSPTFNHNSGTIEFDSNSSGTITCNNVTFNRIVLSGTNTRTVQSDCNLPLGSGPTSNMSITLNGTLTGTGTLAFAASKNLTLNSGASLSGFSGLNVAQLTNAGATSNFSAYSSFTTSGALTLSSGALTLPIGADLNSNLTISGGTFNAPSGNMFVSGNFIFSGSPVFNASGGTITWDGGANSASCNNVTFNLVIIANTSTKTVNSDCNLPLGNNPSIGTNITLNGTLSGTGTLTMAAGTMILNSGASLSGFSALSAVALTNAGATTNLGSYTSFTASNVVTLSSGSLTLPNNADLNSSLTISGGTFNAPSGTMTVAGALTISGAPTFNANSGIVTFDGGGATLSCNNVTFNSVSFTGQTSTKTVSSNCSLPLGSNPTIPTHVSLSGTLSGSGTLTQSAGTMTLNSGATLSGFSGLNVVGFTNAGATTNLGSYTTFSASSTVTVSSGTLTLPSGGADLNGNLTISSGTFTAPSGTLTVTGHLTISGGTFNANGGTISFDGASRATLACNNVTFNLVVISSTGEKTVNSDCSFPLGSNPTLDGDVNLSGVLSGSNTLTLSAGKYLTISTGSSLSGFNGFEANGDIVVNGGTLNLSGYTTAEFNQSFAFYSGSFTAPSTLTLGGNEGTLACGSATFNTVVINMDDTAGTNKVIQSDCTLPLGSNPTLSGAGNLTLGGTLSGTGSLTKTTGTIFLQGDADLSGFSNLNLGSLVVANDELGRWAGDEGSGSSTDDGSGFGNNGSLQGSMGFSTDTPPVSFSNSRSLLFDGVDDYVTAGNDASVRPQFPFSTSLWFKLDSLPEASKQAMLIASSNPSNTDVGYYTGFSVLVDNSGFLTARTGNGMGCCNQAFRKDVITDNPLSTGQWYHLTVNFTSIDDFTIYLNGTQAAATGSGTSTRMFYDESNELRIGSMWNPNIGDDSYFAGKIDDVRLYNRSLTTGEISLLAGGASGIGSQPTFTLGAPATLAGNLTIHDAVFDVSSSSHAINVAGNWTNENSGVFVPRSGTVTLTGGDQSINGSTTFYTLVKSNSNGNTLTFEAGTTQAVTSLLTLQGTSSNRLKLRSSVSGTQWKLDPQGSRSINFVDVKDSRNLNSTTITVSSGLNSGNNTGWSLPGSAESESSSSETSSSTTSSTSNTGSSSASSTLPSTKVNAESQVVEETEITVDAEAYNQALEAGNALEKYVVRIKVVDADRNPIQGALVTLYSDPLQGISDSKGQVIFTGVQPGVHTVVINYRGQTASQVITIKDSEEAATLGYDFTLTLVPTNVFAAVQTQLALLAACSLALAILYMAFRAIRRSMQETKSAA